MCTSSHACLRSAHGLKNQFENIDRNVRGETRYYCAAPLASSQGQADGGSADSVDNGHDNKDKTETWWIR